MSTQPELTLEEKKQKAFDLISATIDKNGPEVTTELYSKFRHLIDQTFLGNNGDPSMQLTEDEQTLILDNLTEALGDVTSGEESNNDSVSWFMRYIEESVAIQRKSGFLRSHETVNVIITRKPDLQNPTRVISTMVFTDLSGKELLREEISDADRISMILFYLTLLGFVAFVVVAAMQNGIHFG